MIRMCWDTVTGFTSLSREQAKNDSCDLGFIWEEMIERDISFLSQLQNSEIVGGKKDNGDKQGHESFDCQDVLRPPPQPGSFLLIAWLKNTHYQGNYYKKFTAETGWA